MRVLSILVISCLTIFACKPTSSADSITSENPEMAIKTLEDSVLAIHDEIMPKMMEITELTTQLRAIKATVKENEDEKFVSPDGLEPLMGALKLAEQGMWDWMKAYSDTKPTLKEDQLIPFYKSQLELIQKVKQDMISSIERTQAWLATQPKN